MKKEDVSTTVAESSKKAQHITLRFGVPCEYPVPTGCSTQRTLDKFVQLNSF
jgi:hypothetical protein